MKPNKLKEIKNKLLVEEQNIQNRIIELKKLGIRDVSFQGQTKIGSLNILGKGYVGVVVLSRIKNKLVAVKIRRTDASRINMVKEAKFLKIANKAGYFTQKAPKHMTPLTRRGAMTLMINR